MTESISETFPKAISTYITLHADAIHWLGHRIIAVCRYAGPLALFLISKKIYEYALVFFIASTAISLSVITLIDSLKQKQISIKFYEEYWQESFWHSAAMLSELSLAKDIFDGLNLSFSGYDYIKLSISFGIGILANFTILKLQEISIGINAIRNQEEKKA